MDKIFNPSYLYKFTITHVRDGDSFKGLLDRGFNDFKADVEGRQYGVDTQEITKSKANKRGEKEVEQGFDHRDAFLTSLDVDPDTIPRKAKFMEIPEREVVVQTIKDSSGKYGRLLTIVHYNGVNVNEAVRDVVGGVNFYDGKTYPDDYPICPPNHPIYDRYHQVEGVVMLKPEYQFP